MIMTPFPLAGLVYRPRSLSPASPGPAPGAERRQTGRSVYKLSFAMILKYISAAFAKMKVPWLARTLYLGHFFQIRII